MDPDFAAVFSSEYPEAYGEAVRSQRGRGATRDAAIAVHVPVIPHFLSRFVAGVAVMLFLIGAFYLIFQNSGVDLPSMPSGQLLNGSAGMDFGTAAENLSALSGSREGLAETIQPIGDAGQSFADSRN